VSPSPVSFSETLPIRVSDEEDDPTGKEGWEVIEMGGQQIGIRTAYLEEKCAAFDTMLTYCATLGAKFAPYLPQALELALPCLNFFFHDGVREACAQ
jgi:importin-5